MSVGRGLVNYLQDVGPLSTLNSKSENVRRTAVYVAVHRRLPSQARQDLNGIDPETRPYEESGNVLASADI